MSPTLVLLIGASCARCTAGGIGADTRAPGGEPVSEADPERGTGADSEPETEADPEPEPEPGEAGEPRTPAETEPETLRVAVVSDLNDSYGSTTYSSAVGDAIARIVERGPDLVLCAGDMVAGQQAGLDYGAMWAGFHEVVSQPLADAGIPLAVTPGNHDASGYAAFDGERAIYVDEWAARRPAVDFRDDREYPLHYSFSVGQALFVSLDDTVVGRLDADQHAWLDGELAAGADFPVKIVFGHLPLMPFTQGRETEILDDADLEQTMVDRGVSLFLSGHHHGYYPGRHGGLRQVSMACLGAGSRRLVGEDAVSELAFTWIEIVDGAITSVEAYAAPDFDAPIPRETLPPNVGAVSRDDL